MNIYSSGQYKKNHPSWHDEDAPWKANEIIRFIKKNNLKLNSVLDIGCGTGRILELVSKSLDIKSATGYEPYEEVIKEASRRFPKLNFSKTLPKKKYDLALLIDVVEHIEKPENLLKDVKSASTYKLFHIPLALSFQAKLRKKPLEYARINSGHLHEFTRESALKFLEGNNYKIIDYKLTKGSILSPIKSSKQRFLNIFRKLLFPLFPEFTSKILGGFSLLALAE